jgi:hypothetical protein
MVHEKYHEDRTIFLYLLRWSVHRFTITSWFSFFVFFISLDLYMNYYGLVWPCNAMKITPKLSTHPIARCLYFLFSPSHIDLTVINMKFWSNLGVPYKKYFSLDRFFHDAKKIPSWSRDFSLSDTPIRSPFKNHVMVLFFSTTFFFAFDALARLHGHLVPHESHLNYVLILLHTLHAFDCLDLTSTAPSFCHKPGGSPDLAPASYFESCALEWFFHQSNRILWAAHDFSLPPTPIRSPFENHVMVFFFRIFANLGARRNRYFPYFFGVLFFHVLKKSPRESHDFSASDTPIRARM